MRRRSVMLSLAVALVFGAQAAAQTEANKAVERRVFEEIWNQGDLNVADEVFAANAILNLGADDLQGPEGFKQYVAGYRAAFPDIHWIVDDQIAEGDLVVTRLTGTGTHQGALMGIPPTGLQVTVTAIATVRIVEGKIQESWSSWDALGLMQQLGVLPPTRESYTWGEVSAVAGDPGDPETNKALVNRLFDEAITGDFDVIDELMAADYLFHDPVSPVELRGPEGYKQEFGMYLTAFPDIQITLDDVVAEGDKVAIRWTLSGTHGGELMGIPATGRQVIVTGTSIYRIADGKFVETWPCYDALGMMQQLTTVTPEELIAIKDAARTALNAHDLDTFLSYFAEDGVFDLVPFGVAFTGADQIQAFLQAEFQAFPDWHIAEQHLLVGGNVVVGEPIISGTHQDLWNGIPATGQAVQLPSLEIVDFEGNKVKKVTIYTDVLTEMIQLGVVAPPEMPPLVPSFAVPDPEPTGLSPLEANDELLARWNAHDVAGMAKMFHSDLMAFDSGLGMPVGREEYVAALEMMLQGSSDMTGQFTRAVDLGDGWVAVEVVFSGSHTGPFMGVPATGRPILLRAGSLRRFDADGLVTDFALYYDNLTIMAQMTAVTPTDPGSDALLAYYPLDTDAGDASGNGLDGTIMGDAELTAGMIGGAIDLDGVDDLVELGQFDVEGTITLAAWIKANDFEINDARIISKANEWGGNDHWWMLSTITGTSLRFRLKTDDGEDTATLVSDPVLEAGVWAHVAATWDGSVMRIYKDGVEVASQEKGGTAVAVDPTISVAIGSQPSDAFASDSSRVVKFFDGLIDEVRIYSRALSAGEVLFLTGYMADVIAPGDLVEGVPNDDDWPGAETPDLAIDDNVNTKYLHFKGDFEPDAGPTGFRVKPSVGPTVVTAVTFTTANDVPGRDPIAFALYGSNVSIDGPYTLIASRDIVDFAQAAEWPRFTKNATPIVLANDTAYTYYQVLITAIRGPVGGSVNSMQIAEVELMGIPILPPPDPEANKAATQRIFDEIWNQGNMDTADELIAADLVRVDTGNPDVSGPVGVPGLKLLVAGYRAAFPDIQFTVDDMIAEDDMVVTRWTTTGTHLGELMGIPPTGAAVTSTGISLLKWVDGKMQTEWVAWDSLGLMQQLGVVAPPRPVPEDYAWLPPSPLTGDPGDPEINKTMVTRFVEEVWNEKKLDPIVELFHPETAGSNPSVDYLYAPFMPPTRDEGFTQSIADYLAAYPDMDVTVHRMVTEGDKVLAYWTVNATHGGELAGVPATGNPVTISGHTMYRFADNQIVDSWWAWDTMGMMGQITPP